MRYALILMNYNLNEVKILQKFKDLKKIIDFIFEIQVSFWNRFDVRNLMAKSWFKNFLLDSNTNFAALAYLFGTLASVGANFWVIT